jgi:hypothetical protein
MINHIVMMLTTIFLALGTVEVHTQQLYLHYSLDKELQKNCSRCRQ